MLCFNIVFLCICDIGSIKTGARSSLAPVFVFFNMLSKCCCFLSVLLSVLLSAVLSAVLG